MHYLASLGWNEYRKQFPSQEDVADVIPARIIREDRRAYIVQTDTEITYAELTGKLGFETEPSDRPKVGDWVMGSQETKDMFVIKDILQRKNKISRKVI